MIIIQYFLRSKHRYTRSRNSPDNPSTRDLWTKFRVCYLFTINLTPKSSDISSTFDRSSGLGKQRKGNFCFLIQFVFAADEVEQGWMFQLLVSNRTKPTSTPHIHCSTNWVVLQQGCPTFTDIGSTFIFFSLWRSTNLAKLWNMYICIIIHF